MDDLEGPIELSLYLHSLHNALRPSNPGRSNNSYGKEGEKKLKRKRKKEQCLAAYKCVMGTVKDI